jgi:signal transduction histidine kinase
LQVTDNGKGFDPALNQEMKGIGMKNIFARAKFIGARVELNSSGGQGTTYIISYEADKSLK